MPALRSIAAPAEQAYRLMAEESTWPVVFEQVVHVQRERGRLRTDRLRVWVHEAGAVHEVTVRRRLDPRRLRVALRQEGAPALPLCGRWTFRETVGGHTEVTLDHPDAAPVLGANSRTTLTAAAAYTERRAA
jgi:aromatase